MHECTYITTLKHKNENSDIFNALLFNVKDGDVPCKRFYQYIKVTWIELHICIVITNVIPLDLIAYWKL